MRNFSSLLVILGCGLVLSCGPNREQLGSAYLDYCFTDYEDPSELTEALNKLSEQIDSFMAVRGCLNYQLGHYALAEESLKKAFQDSEEGEETRGLSASALSLIYLKERQKQNIKPYKEVARQHSIGRWMLTLYHIDNYRETADSAHLQSAIEQIQAKHLSEGETSATQRLLQHMLLIKQMEDLCEVYSHEKSPSAVPALGSAETVATTAGVSEGVAESPDSQGQTGSSEVCQRAELEGEKKYLFSTANGFLTMLVKAPPFNTFRLRSLKETKSEG